MKRYKKIFEQKINEVATPKTFDYKIKVGIKSVEEILAECINYLFKTSINGLDIIEKEGLVISNPSVVTSKIPLAGSNSTEIHFNVGKGVLKGIIHYYEPTGLLNKHISPIYWIDCLTLDEKAKIKKAIIQLI
jgi:hypothetical protein